MGSMILSYAILKGPIWEGADPGIISIFIILIVGGFVMDCVEFLQGPKKEG